MSSFNIRPRSWRAVLPIVLGPLLVAATSPAQRPVSGAETRPPTSPATAAPADDNDPVLVGAGDIARCDRLKHAKATARLLDDIPGTVFIPGDAGQDDGRYQEYRDCFHRAWGRHKSRIRPVPGNHDYHDPAAAGYFEYFGQAAGEPGRGYYSYDLGGWHVVAINSNCSDIDCAAEMRWLRADLAAHPRRCVAAYWHHPLFTSATTHRPTARMRPFFQALYEHGAEIVMTGHNHVYERFAAQDAHGNLDRDRGVREFVVGTGGSSHYPFGTPAANSEFRDGENFGVLTLTLHADGYNWEFIAAKNHRVIDSGSDRCH